MARELACFLSMSAPKHALPREEINLNSTLLFLARMGRRFFCSPRLHTRSLPSMPRKTLASKEASYNYPAPEPGNTSLQDIHGVTQINTPVRESCWGPLLPHHARIFCAFRRRSCRACLVRA